MKVFEQEQRECFKRILLRIAVFNQLNRQWVTGTPLVHCGLLCIRHKIDHFWKCTKLGIKYDSIMFEILVSKNRTFTLKDFPEVYNRYFISFA